MLRTGHLLHPASTPASRPTPGASLPGTLSTPRTGLSPAGSRELLLSSSPENSSSLDAPEPSGRTPAQRPRALRGQAPAKAGGHAVPIMNPSLGYLIPIL